MQQTTDPTEESATVGGIHRLPEEILTWIFSHLPIDSLACVSYVCRRWRGILKSRTSLWKRHKVTFNNAADIREVLLTVNAMPPLKTLHLWFAQSLYAKIAWPTVVLRIPDTWEMRQGGFVVKNLVIQYSSGKDIFFYLSWVRLETLERLYLGGIMSDRCIKEKLALTRFLRVDAEAYLLSNLCLEYSSCLDTVFYTSHRGESWNSSLEAALAIANREASLDLEGAGGNCSSLQPALCPVLETVTIYCDMPRINLETVYRLGPMRVLCLGKCTVVSLSFLPHCASRLEELVIRDCSALQETELQNLSCLQRLRVLKLSKCPFSLSVVQTYTAHLPHLESIEVTCP